MSELDLPTAVKPPSNTPYLIAVVVMVLVGVIAILAIQMVRPDKDNMSLIGQVAALVVPTTAAILAFMKSQETHLSVNSRLDAFMKEHGARVRSEALLQGAADEQARVAAIPMEKQPAAPTQLAPLAAPVGPVVITPLPKKKGD